MHVSQFAHDSHILNGNDITGREPVLEVGPSKPLKHEHPVPSDWTVCYGLSFAGLSMRLQVRRRRVRSVSGTIFVVNYVQLVRHSRHSGWCSSRRSLKYSIKLFPDDI